MYWTIFKRSMALDLISFALFDVYLNDVCHDWNTAKRLYTSTGSWHVFVPEPFLMPAFIEPCLLSANANKNKHNMAFFWLCLSVSLFSSFYLLNYKCPLLGRIYPTMYSIFLDSSIHSWISEGTSSRILLNVKEKRRIGQCGWMERAYVLMKGH